MGGDQTLNIIIKARDEATATLNKFKGTVDDMKPAFQKMAAAGTVAFAGITAIAKSSLSAYAEAQAQTANATNILSNSLKGMTEDQLKATTGWETAKGALGEVTLWMQKAGKAAVNLGFDDEEAATAYAKLFQITGDGKSAMDELAIAQDLARFSGQSLESATSALAKVHAGGTRVLKEFGIEVEDGTTALDAMAIIADKTAGSAQTFADTTAGAMEILKVQTDNLKESIGESLAPAFAKVVSAVQPLLERFATWAEANPELLSKIILIGGAVAALVAVMGALGLILPIIITGFTLLASPIIIVTALLVAAAIMIITKWKEIKGGLDVVWDGIVAGLKGLVNFSIGLAEGFANAWVNAVNFVIGALNKIQFSIPDWVPGIGGKSFGINIELMKSVSLPRLEQGGIVPGARGTAVPIIAHGGEEIIPARNAGGSEGMAIEIVMNYPSFKNQEDTDVVRKQIESALRDVVRVYKLQPL